MTTGTPDHRHYHYARRCAIDTGRTLNPVTRTAPPSAGACGVSVTLDPRSMAAHHGRADLTVSPDGTYHLAITREDGTREHHSGSLVAE